MKRYLSAQLVVTFGLFVILRSACFGDSYYQFNIDEMPCLESFALIESEIGLSHGTASRSMTVQNADDRVSIKIYRSVSGIASKEVYKAQLWAFGSSKSPVAVGDEAVKVGESGVGFM